MSSTVPIAKSGRTSPITVVVLVLAVVAAVLVGISFVEPAGRLAAARTALLPSVFPSRASSQAARPKDIGPEMGVLPSVASPEDTMPSIATTGATSPVAAPATAPPAMPGRNDGTLPPTAAMPTVPTALVAPSGAAGTLPPMAQAPTVAPSAASLAASSPAPALAAGEPAVDPFLLSATSEPALPPPLPTAFAASNAAVGPPTQIVPAARSTGSVAAAGATSTRLSPSGVAPAVLPTAPSARPSTAATSAAALLGLRLGDVARDEASLRVGLLPIGAIVLEVVPGSEAAAAGLLQGDRIVSAGAQHVVSAFHYLFLVTQRRNGPLDLEVIRSGVLYRTTLVAPPPTLAAIR